MSIINNISEHKIETRKETRWFSIIKEKASDIDYGTIELILTVKKGEVNGLKIKEQGKTYNIGS